MHVVLQMHIIWGERGRERFTNVYEYINVYQYTYAYSVHNNNIYRLRVFIKLLLFYFTNSQFGRYTGIKWNRKPSITVIKSGIKMNERKYVCVCCVCALGWPKIQDLKKIRNFPIEKYFFALDYICVKLFCALFLFSGQFEAHFIYQIGTKMYDQHLTWNNFSSHFLILCPVSNEFFDVLNFGLA